MLSLKIAGVVFQKGAKEKAPDESLPLLFELINKTHWQIKHSSAKKCKQAIPAKCKQQEKKIK